MFDFPDSEGLQRITREIFERGAIVSSVCHGYCGLLNTKLSDGTLLVAGRNLTGFAWSEEVLARVDKLVPYNAEAEMKKRGARYEKGLIPFAPHVVVDGRLVTGQNPGSAKATAKKVVAVLEGLRCVAAQSDSVRQARNRASRAAVTPSIHDVRRDGSMHPLHRFGIRHS